MQRYYVIRLLPPRATFMLDMNETEKKVMKEHSDYWRSLADKGIAIIFGPVLDPKGLYGLGIVRVAGADRIKEIMADDPAMKSGLGSYESSEFLAVMKGDD